jgi:surface protein
MIRLSSFANFESKFSYNNVELDPCSEDRYNTILWLYRIRTQYRRMGLFQPDFICIIFGKLMRKRTDRSQNDINEAVRCWIISRNQAQFLYGHISNWNVSQVTKMTCLFDFKDTTSISYFNDDISKWDVSNVTHMDCIFRKCIKFDGDLSKWDVSNVITMYGAFWGAIKFSGNNGDENNNNVGISNWNVSNVKSMQNMFCDARNFNCDLSNWNVSNVKNTTHMFMNCQSFLCDISLWNIQAKCCVGKMFKGCNINDVMKPTRCNLLTEWEGDY